MEITPELTEDRLCILGRMIRDVRNKAVNSYNPPEGDGLWSLGCLIYERIINTIEHEAKHLTWLDTYRKNLYFVIIINEVHLRFCKGKMNKPTERMLRQKYPEILSEQLLFDFESRSNRFWRIVVETESNGKVFRILLVQYDKYGNSYNQWEIPITEPVSAVSPVRPIRREGVDLGKPAIRRRNKTLSEETKDVGKK